MKRDKLSLINMVFGIFFFAFLLTSVNLTLTNYVNRGVSWEVTTVVDGEFVVHTEHISTYVGSSFLVAILFCLSIANFERFRFYRKVLLELQAKIKKLPDEMLKY